MSRLRQLILVRAKRNYKGRAAKSCGCLGPSVQQWIVPCSKGPNAMRCVACAVRWCHALCLADRGIPPEWRSSQGVCSAWESRLGAGCVRQCPSSWRGHCVLGGTLDRRARTRLPFCYQLDFGSTGGGGKFRPGTISQGIISPGENFATLEIPKAASKHVSRKMSLNFRKKIFCLSVCICPLMTQMSDVVITPVVRVLGSDCTGVGSNPGDAMFFICPALVNLMRLVFHAQTNPA